jgi:lysophospholipase L1-like esterase
MKKRIIFTALFLAALFYFTGCNQEAKMSKTDIDSNALKPIVIALVGDSTVADYPPEKQLQGWGQVLPEFFNDKVTIKNFARNGRSSKSFIKEGLWDNVLLSKADYIFIQFGHNDCPGKADRTTDPNTDFQEYLRKYINDSRKISAQPILVTSMERRKFDKNGKIQQTIDKYSAAMKIVAKKENVPLIDLHDKSVKLYESLGERDCAFMNTSAKPDTTHFTHQGATTMARLLVEEIPKQVPSLEKYLKKADK